MLTVFAAPWYQPETTYQIFKRVMFNTDVATGTTRLGTNAFNYSTTGPSDVANVKNKLPAPHKPECYFWDMFQTCSNSQIEMMRNGTAVVRDYIMVGYRKADGTSVHY